MDPLAFNALWAVLLFVSKQVTLLKEFTQLMCKPLEILDTINTGLSNFAETLQSQNSQTSLFSANLKPNYLYREIVLFRYDLYRIKDSF